MKNIPGKQYLLIALPFLFRTLVAEALPSLAVSNLDAQGITESEAVVLSDQLRSEFVRSRQFRIVERTQMEEILKEQGFQSSGCTSDQCAVEMGQLLGVKNMVVGSIGKAGSYTILTARIIDVSSGEVLVQNSQRERGGIDKMIETGIHECAGDLIKAYNERLNPQSPPTAGTKPADVPEKGQKPQLSNEKTHRRKAILIPAISAVVVSGGAAAFLLARDKTEDDGTPNNQTTTPNVEIDLP